MILSIACSSLSERSRKESLDVGQGCIGFRKMLQHVVDSMRAADTLCQATRTSNLPALFVDFTELREPAPSSCCLFRKYEDEATTGLDAANAGLG